MARNTYLARLRSLEARAGIGAIEPPPSVFVALYDAPDADVTGIRGGFEREVRIERQPGESIEALKERAYRELGAADSSAPLVCVLNTRGTGLGVPLPLGEERWQPASDAHHARISELELRVASTWPQKENGS